MASKWTSRHFRPVSRTDDLGKALGWLRGESRDPPVVLDGDRPFAVVNVRALMSRGIHHDTHMEKIAQPVPVLGPDDGIDEAVKAFQDTLVPYLPVADERGKAVGVAWAQDVLAEAYDDGPMAADVLSEGPTLQEGDRMEEALHAFASTWDSHLAVLRGRRIVGVLPRSTAIRINEFEAQGAGRMDFGGEAFDARQEGVEGHMEAAWSECPANLAFGPLVEQMKDQGYAFVVGDDGAYLGTATPVQVLRATRAATATA